MKFNHRHAALALTAAVPAMTALAQDEELAEPWGIRFRVQGRVQFNFQARFTDTRPVLADTPGLYADGYVLAGSNTRTNDPAAVTWNWGYDRADQIAGSTLTLTRYDDVPRAAVGDTSGGSTGFGGELWAMYELYNFPVWKKRTGRWGFEAGYGYGSFEASTSGEATGVTRRRQGLYGLGGIVPPPPGQRGTFEGPVPGGPSMPVIDFAALSTPTVTATGMNAFSGSLSSDFHTVKLGPWVELPVTDRLSVGLGAGYCAMLVQAELTFRDTTTFAGNPAAFAAAAQDLAVRSKRHDWRPGMYAQARLTYAFNPSWSITGGVDLQSNSDFQHATQGRGVKVELGTVFGAVLGVQYGF